MVLGAGGHGKVVDDAVLAAGDTVLGYLDDSSEKRSVWGRPVMATFSAWAELL